jgi:PAS domain S-box-containing protein
VTTTHKDAPDFRALLGGAPGLYLVLTPGFKIVGASDSYLRATLTTRENILQRAVFDVFPDNPKDFTPDGASKLRESLERVLRDGVSDTMAVQKHAIRLPELAGGGLEERFFSPVNSPVFDAENRLTYIIHRFEDVTDIVHLSHPGASPTGRKPDASALLLPARDVQGANGQLGERNARIATAAEDELRALFDVMPQSGWTARPDGFRDFYNRRWYEYSGTTPEQMEGAGWKTLHDPEMLPLVVRQYEESFRTGTPFEMDYPLRRSDGVFRWFRTRACPIRNAEGTIVRWVGTNTDIDDERQATRAGDEFHAAILSNMGEGICLVRASDNIIAYTNPKFDVMLGYEVGELSGKPVALIAPKTLAPDRAIEAVRAELEREGRATYDVALLHKDGHEVWCRARSSRLKTPSFGWVWVGVHEDITERKAVAKEWRSFFEMSFDLLAIANFGGYFTRLNPAWERTLGWSSEELMSTLWKDFVHPDDVQATLDVMDQLRSGAVVISFENRYHCKDGTYRWLQWNSMPVMERNIIYVTARDITQEKQAKEALRELSASLETTLHSIGDGVIATDVKGTVIRMNPVAERITGWTQAEANGRPFAEVFKIIDETTRAIVQSPIERSLRTGAIIGLETHTLFVRRDGSELAIGDSCAPIRTDEGTVNGAVIVFRDLTGERRTAAVQAKYQQQLVFADRMASVGTLAAGVAHEINNPLTYITANIDTVLEEVRSLAGGSASGRMKDIEENLLEAREGASRVARIVRGLKTFSRIEEERLGVVDLVPVLELSINMAFNEIRHRARLVKDYGKIPLVDADDARLGQVFINLLVNAAQALPDGHSEENEIRIIASTDAAGRAVVEVRDTGPGIPPELLARIFDPFFTTKPAGIGTGLGLAICHNIITGMGGEISVQSELGQGTTFRVVLPASRGPIRVAKPVGTSSKNLSLPPASVLVVDDEPAVGFAVRRVLRAHEVAVVTTAQAALDLLATGREFDVILSDLMMPGMSGIEFHGALARLYPKMASRVVFVTGGAFTPEANDFLDRVSNERMEKPFELHQLREMVQKFVKGATPAPAVASNAA